jgi:hypothetical protein
MTDAQLKANRERTAHLLGALHPNSLVHWCPRCGDAFTAGGARTIARGDPSCSVRMTKGLAHEAITSLIPMIDAPLK